MASPGRLARRLGALEATFDSGPLAGLLYGLACGLVLCGAVLVLKPTLLQHFNRAPDLADAVRAYDHGQPLLVAQTAHGALYPAARGDDPGLFILGPLLGRATGIHDSLLLVRLLLLALYLPAIVVAPLLFRRITGSPVAALLATAGVTAAAFVFEVTPYWAGAWAVLVLIPLVMWIDTGWRRAAGALLVVIAALAGVASAIRAEAGLPVIIAILIALATRAPWRVWTRAAVAVAAVACYVLVSSTAISAVVSSRDHYRPIATQYPQGTATHVLWHNAYLGLGYLPNRYGIWWDDSVGLASAERRDPRVQFLTPHYEHDLRELTLDLLKDDPGLAAVTYAKKLVVSIMWSAPLLLLLILTLPAAMRRERALTRRLMLLLVPALLLGILPGLAGLPVPEYLYGLLSGLVLLCVVTISLTLSHALRLRSQGLRASSIVHEELYPQGRLVAAAVVALVVGLAGWAVVIRGEASRWMSQHGGETAIVRPASLPAPPKP